MKKMNNKGFTLVEVISVVAILSILLIVLIPNVNSLFKKGEEDAYNSLKKSILVAAEDYVKDNRYEIDFGGEGEIYIRTLLDFGYLSSTDTGSAGDYIVNPKNRSKRLDLDRSYVVITFDSDKKDYEFILEDSYLKWK